MRAIVTVIGSDKVGIVAAVSNALANNNINILDIQQGVLRDVFSMVMLTDITEMKVPFSDISEILSGVGKEIGLDIKIQREDIFDAMNRI